MDVPVAGHPCIVELWATWCDQHTMSQQRVLDTMRHQGQAQLACHLCRERLDKLNQA